MFRCYRAVSVSPPPVHYLALHEHLAEMAGTSTHHFIMTMYNSSQTSGSSRRNVLSAFALRTFQPFEKPLRKSVRATIRRYVT